MAVSLLAAAATASTIRSHPPSTDHIVGSAGMTLLKDLTVDANKLPTADFDDRRSAMIALPPPMDTAQRRLDVALPRGIEPLFQP